MIPVKRCDTKNEGLPLIKRGSLHLIKRGSLHLIKRVVLPLIKRGSLHLIKRGHLTKTNKMRRNKNKVLVYNARKNAKTLQKNRRR